VQLVSDAAALAIKMPGAPPMTVAFDDRKVVLLKRAGAFALATDDAVATISGTPKPAPPSTTE
jgi:hypothetical protein